MRSFALVLVLAAFACLPACSGDSVDHVDANPAGPLCTKVVYDLCSTEHDCTSAMCHLFMADGFQVCTQACDATSPCPKDKSGAAGTCNTMGICKPSAPNMCHL